MMRKASQLVPIAGLILLFLSVCLVSQLPAQGMPKGSPAKDGKETGKAADAPLPKLPDHLDVNQVDHLVAGLSDQQVRRLLIEELKDTARREEIARTPQPATGFARLIGQAGEASLLFHRRMAEILSGARSKPDFLPEAYQNLQGSSTSHKDALMALLILIGLYGAGWGAEMGFRRAVANLRSRLEGYANGNWTDRFKRLGMEFLLDLVSVTVFILTNAALFLILFEDHGFRHVVFVTYVIVILLLRGILILTRFALSPTCPKLRLLPLDDSTAQYLHQWVVRLAVIVGLGWLLVDLLKLLQTHEAVVLLTSALFGVVVTALIIYLLLANRRPVANALCRQAIVASCGSRSLKAQIASEWHLLMIPYVVALFAVWLLAIFLGQQGVLYPVFTLFFSIPIYLIGNGMAQRLLDGALGIAHGPCPPPQEDSSPVCAAENLDPGVAPGTAPVPPLTEKVIPFLRAFLRLCLAGTVLFWLLGSWGFEVSVEERVAGAAFEILVALTLTYVAWRLIEKAINQRLKEARPVEETEDGAEHGSSGGSRIGTLLLLLRKFVLIVLLIMVTMIVLSSVGINIGPLLAGAGVIGLALGFGSQALVKDIISGVFFLVDDALRVGDYIDTGKAKGTVEHISIRSIRLRHPRGMIHTLPFSQLGTVTNFSRDYCVEKLDIPVPYATDIDRVRKIVKKIDQQLAEDPELAPLLLDPIKSQGIKALTDSGLVMRVKFKTRPGGQFAVRKEVLHKLREAFQKHGLEFSGASPNIIVQLPLDTTPVKSATEPGQSELPREETAQPMPVA